MDRRLRPVRRRTLAVIAGALVLAAPWTGWWTLVPLVAAVGFFRGIERRIDGAARPEILMFAGWVGVETIIAISVAAMGSSSVTMLGLLAIPVVTLSARFSTRGIWAGVGIAAALICLVALTTNSAAVGDNPPLLIAPLAVVVAAAMLSTALMRSDVEHRGKSSLDALTGLLNRQSLEGRAREIAEQSRITGEPTGVVMLDLDGFKEINDTYGHAVGDGVLVEAAYRLRKELRTHDLIYRLGGDEFLILVPGGDLEDAKRIGLRARAIIGEVSAGDPEVRVTPSVRISASCGVSASFRGEPFRFDAIFECADAAMYEAKENGGFASREGFKVENYGAGAL